MRKHRMLVLLSALILPVGAVSADVADWPQFRGPSGQGLSDAKDLPVEIADPSPLMKWKTPIPGKAWSSPVIVGDQIWLTNATEDGRELSIVTVDKNSGKVLRNEVLFKVEAPQFCHPFNSYASPTPAVDAEAGRIYVTFGSPGTACLDAKTGQKIWERRDFVCNHYRAAGSSILLYKDRLFLPFDGSDFQYIVAMEKQTGKTIWKTDRSVDFRDLDPKTGKPDREGDWRKGFSTPRIMMVDGKPILISTASKATYAYDPETGKELWRLEHPGQHSGSITPVIGKDLFYICTGHGKAELWAVDPRGAGSGVLPASHVKWKVTKNVPTRCSPLLVGNLIYIVDDNGIGSCYDAATGEEKWKQRIKGQFSAAPVLADGRIYFFSEGGFVTVIEPGAEFKKPLFESKFATGFMAGPAISGKAIFLRSRTDLYRFEK